MQEDMTQDEIDAILKGAMGNANAGEKAPPDRNIMGNQAAENADLLSEGVEGQAVMTPVSGRKEETEYQKANAMGNAPVGSTSDMKGINFLLDVPLDVSVELGRTRMAIKEMIQLGPGSVVELNKLIGEPVDLLVNDRLIARGEVVVFDENFGIRITDIVNPEDRIKSLR